MPDCYAAKYGRNHTVQVSREDSQRVLTVMRTSLGNHSHGPPKGETLDPVFALSLICRMRPSEGQLVGGFFDEFGGGLAGAVAGAGFDSDEDGGVAGVLALEHGGELK